MFSSYTRESLGGFFCKKLLKYIFILFFLYIYTILKTKKMENENTKNVNLITIKIVYDAESIIYPSFTIDDCLKKHRKIYFEHCKN